MTTSAAFGRRDCSGCALPMSGQFVRALGGTYHLDCFRCKDCNAIVAQKFFPFADEANGVTYPLCERDYFRRLNLLCHNCGQALRGSYIQALGAKYHVDHFTCSICPTVFGPAESYYEHEGNVYCHYHYSTLYATRCAGCNIAILKQFVEINRNDVDEQWHPECYMINKSWSIRLAVPDNEGDVGTSDTNERNAEQLKTSQKLMEDKVSRIWSVLSMFEESAAACISDMLLNVSNGHYVEGVNEAASFILHVEVLFSGIDEIELDLKQRSDRTGLHHTKEPKLLCKKIVAFFSLLSHTQELGSRRLGITQELLSLVTSLAHLLKILIRIALSGALKLERVYHVSTAIHTLLNKLLELSDHDKTNVASVNGPTPSASIATLPTITDNGSNNNGNRVSAKIHLVVDTDVKSDLCHACRLTIEEECFKLGSYRWHVACLTCRGCNKELRNECDDTFWAQASAAVYCNSCKPEEAVRGFQRVTLLEQYTFLLRVALKRLYSLLKVKGGEYNGPYVSTQALSTSPSASSVLTGAIGSTNQIGPDNNEQARKRGDKIGSTTPLSHNAISGLTDLCSKSFSNTDRPSLDQISIQRMTKPLVADHTLDDSIKLSDLSTQAKRRTLVEPTSSPSVHNLIEAAQSAGDIRSLAAANMSVLKGNENISAPIQLPEQPHVNTTALWSSAMSSAPIPVPGSTNSQGQPITRSATTHANVTVTTTATSNGLKQSNAIRAYPITITSSNISSSSAALPSSHSLQRSPKMTSVTYASLPLLTSSNTQPRVGSADSVASSSSSISISATINGGRAPTTSSTDSNNGTSHTAGVSIHPSHIPLPLSSSPNDFSFPSHITPQDISFTNRIRQRTFLSELSALEYFIVKHLAVCNMAPLVGDYFTLEELLELIESKKATLWSRFMSSLKGKNKPKSKIEGTFGVPLEILLDRAGVHSNLGAGPGRIRIPKIMDVLVSNLRQSDLYVQGIFRLNGNIRRLNQLREDIDKDPLRIEVGEENSVQLAALLKKWLRELPEPLLTFKLHRLFVVSQRISNETQRKRILHYICCLLPKCNRDVMEVLFLLLRDAAQCALPDDPDRGSKMDMSNLALVVSPNVLYSKGRDPLKDENAACVQGVLEMLMWQDEFHSVPEDIAALLSDENLTEGMTEMNAKDILRKVETLVKLKKSHSSGGVYVVNSDDHTASNAQIEEESS